MLMNISKNYEKAAACFQSGDIVAAKRLCKLIICKDKKHKDALNVLANCYIKESNFELALRIINSGLKFTPEYVPLIVTKANICLEKGDYQKAKSLYEVALAKSEHYSIYTGLAKSLHALGEVKSAIKTYEKAIAKDLLPTKFMPDYITCKRHLCVWDSFNGEQKALENSIDVGNSIHSLIVADDNPLRTLKRNQQFGSRFKSKYPHTRLTPAGNCKPKIGFFSSDFYSHATMQLLFEVLMNLDREKLAIYIFDYSNKSDDITRKLQESDFEYINIRAKSVDEVEEDVKIRNIDIAIDLKGYTKNSRPAIFARRMAPIQVNYLGYPSTTGSATHDYIIADNQLIDKVNRPYVSEKVICLPGSYQPAYSVRTEGVTRKYSNFTFCCLNNSYKITPIEVETWSKILHECKTAKLLLLKDHDDVEINIKLEFSKYLITEDRLNFVSRTAHQVYMRNLSMCHVFLDTFTCNAHTTASDAMRSGIPLVTLRGDNIVSRVSASLLAAQNLNELITTNQAEYIKVAVELYRSPRLYDEICKKVLLNEYPNGIYDVRGYANSFENAMLTIWDNFHAGLNPKDIYID